MTTRIMMSKKRIKKLNKENMIEIFHLLQPVLHTDTEHGADYYGYGYGSIIKAKQQAYIDVLKHNIINCKTKVEIGNLLGILNADINYFPGYIVEEKKKKGLTEFWEDNFGKKIVSEWGWMLQKFINHLNEMIEIE